MNQINTIIPFVFEDHKLKINNKPILVPSSNSNGQVEKHHAFTLLSGRFNNKQDLLDTIHAIGLDIDPAYLDIKKNSYVVKYKDDIQITVEDMYQDKLDPTFNSNYEISTEDNFSLFMNKPYY